MKPFLFLKGKQQPAVTSIAESDAGRRFIARARRDAWELNSRIAWWALIGFNLASAIGHFFVFGKNIPTSLILFHVVGAIWAILYIKVDYRSKWNYGAWPIFSSFFIWCHFDVVRYQVQELGGIVIEDLAVAIVLVFITTMIVPGPAINSISTAIFSVIAGSVALKGVDIQIAYTLMILLIAIGGSAWNAVSVANIEQMARSSLLMRITMAPAHVAERAINESGVAKAFPIEERQTAVIVIKWSDLASYSHDLLPARLDQLLTEYFGIVDSILISQLPRGAWFADVIQHEIHVYLFLDSNASSLESEAIEFAVELMSRRRERTDLDLMGFLDIGVSCGLAYSGIIGPKLYQKTTVIGAPAARAISAKTLGVPIRNHFGGSDRILFDSNVAKFVKPHQSMYSIFAPGIFDGRQWSDDWIFVIESPTKVALAGGGS